jgi:caffeoyl-CoA O-methyltransferase
MVFPVNRWENRLEYQVSKSFGQSDPRIEKFVYDVYRPEDAELEEIRARSRQAGLPDIEMAPLDARHVEVIARACGARRAVEIGTLGGYSGAILLKALGPDGFLHTFELFEHHAAVARESFDKLNLSGRVRVHVGPALENLTRIEGEGPFDLVLIDADKEQYAAYVEWAARNLRIGGVVLCDNAFLFGHITDEPVGKIAHEIISMRGAHELLAHSGRFRATVFPSGEGLAVGVKVA